MVRAGLIASHHLAAARALQASDGGTIGEHLVAVGAVSDEALTEFYRSRLMVPQINPNTLARLSTAVVAMLPGDMAVEFRAVPVSLDKDGNLTVAMSDPSDRHAVDEIAFFTGKYVVRAVATQMQLAWCLAQYYGHVTELGERLLQPVADASTAAPPPAPSPAPAAAPTPLPRQRGDTARVEAARHRVLAPITTPPPVGPRPGPEALARATARPPAATSVAAAPSVPATPSVPAAPSVAAAPSVPAAVAAAASGPVTIELQVDDPSGPVRAPADLPAALLDGPRPAAAPAPEPTPSVIVSPEATQPRRKRPAVPDPPELAARSGELLAHESRTGMVIPSASVEIHLDDEPAAPTAAAAPVPPVTIEDSAGVTAPARPVSDDDTHAPQDDDEAEAGAADRSQPVVIHDREADPAYIHDELTGSESQPILLDRPRRSSTQEAVGADATDTTDAPDEPAAAAAPPEAAPEPLTTDEPSAPILLVARKRGGERRREKRTQLGLGAFAALGPIPPSPASAGRARTGLTPAAPPTADTAASPLDRDAVPAAVSEDDEAKTRRVETRGATDDLDDGWGPPGTTIPPPFLGATVPPDDTASGSIPVHEDDPGSAPLLVGAPLEARPRATSIPPDAAEHARALEAAAARLVDALRTFDQATSRDHVIALLVDFVGESHHRVAFLVSKAGELTAFMQTPPPTGPQARLSLSAPSVFQDVVGTRLPYRGPISDPVSRELVRALFGSTTDEMVAVPVAVRDRVVGVIYADGRQRHAFDEHVAVAARAAGLALERLLISRRT
ncbi:MAG: hypothetical protein KJZ91_28895 [Myxococcales bacterium]|nr:hypothetical protein [Myxococcales bacterium]